MSRVKPLLVPLVMLVFGILVGMLVGWSTVQIVDTGPWQLHPDFQALYVQAVADAYANDQNVERALSRLSYLCGTEGVEAAIASAGAFADGTQRAHLDELRSLLPQWAAASAEVCTIQPGGALKTVRQILPIVAILAVLGLGGYVVYSVMQAGEAAEKPAAKPAVGSSRATAAKPPPKLETAKSPAARGAAIAAVTEKTDFAKAGEPPLVQFMTTYLVGDDLFDDSFSVETPSGEFLGETGVGISETIGVGEPKRVTAFEVWLFDKNDIRTVTKVLMSDHAFNDEALKAKLAPKGEAVVARPGQTLTLETATLRVTARVVDLAYGSGPLPPNSFFERITIELAAWKREDAKPAPTAARPDTLPEL
jgi:hypothetical protein